MGHVSVTRQGVSHSEPRSTGTQTRQTGTARDSRISPSIHPPPMPPRPTMQPLRLLQLPMQLPRHSPRNLTAQLTSYARSCSAMFVSIFLISSSIRFAPHTRPPNTSSGTVGPSHSPTPQPPVHGRAYNVHDVPGPHPAIRLEHVPGLSSRLRQEY